MFEEMNQNIQEDTLKYLFHIEINTPAKEAGGGAFH